DVEFSIQLQKQNKFVSVFPELALLHKKGKTCHKDSYYTTYLYQRNRLVISWKYSNSIRKIFLLIILSKDITKRFFRDFQNKKMDSFYLFIQALGEGAKMIIRNKKTP
ncbi:MAG: hypothetical protein KDD45_12100, partial [Bdellovibrionales bacterium]|nr:hypothetical protein [Bdellovibrionales bacterium]